jgi:hypothetical protein
VAARLRIRPGGPGQARSLAAQAEKDGLTYPAERELEADVALAALVTALAMNHVLRGAYET